MLRRFSTLYFASLLALIVGISGRSAAAARSGDTSVYHVENHEQQVTVKDADGKTLASRHIATPTCKAVVSVWWDENDEKSVSPRVSLTVEDANGLRLWDASIPFPRHFKSHGSITCNVKANDSTPGTELDVNFTEGKPKPDASDAAATEDKKPEAFSMVFVIGANGRPVSMDAIDGTGQVHHAALSMGADGVDISGFDGVKAHIGPTGDDGKINSEFEINGVKITMTTVERDGKTYMSLPWNGHQLLIEQGCTFHIDGDGNLTIDAPTGQAKK